MKTGNIILSVCFTALYIIAGCSDYERKGVVTPDITVNAQSLNLFVGQTEQLKAGPAGLSFSWTSEDTEVAGVDGSGLVTAAGEGNTFIAVRSGDKICRLPVSVAVKIPMTGFRLSVTEMELNPKARRSVVVILEPENANDASHPVWRSLNTDVATVDYKGEITGVTEGITEVVCAINGIEHSVTVEVPGTTPFMAHIISAAQPYILQAIDFDFGGEGSAYHDNDAGNQGGNSYRADRGDPNCGVDIGGDLAVGWTGGGEWLVYTIDVQDAGEYYLSLDAAVSGNSTFHIDLLEGSGVYAAWKNLSGAVSLSTTGGWSNWWWIDVTNPVTLPAGVYRIRYYFDNPAFNFRSLKFSHRDYDIPAIKSILSGVTDWKIGPWTAMRDPNNRYNNPWWDFKDPSIMNDIFTFNADGSFIHENNGDSFMNESMGDLFPDGDTEGSFVTEHYTPPAGASWDVSRINGKLILTINKGFFGYAAEENDLVQAQYSIVPDYSNSSFRLIHYSNSNWCYEIVPAD